jgi:hypothetical protein
MRSLTKRRLGILCAGLGLAGTAFGLAGGAASAAVGPDVEPILISGSSNQTCSDFAVSHGGGQTWLEVKFDPPNDGTQSGITIVRDGNTFTWTSTVGIDAVFVKSGSQGSNLYVYAPTADSPESFGDDGLTSIQAISHISFCYDTANPTTTTTEAETTTTEAETTTTEAETTTTEAETTTTTEAETTTTTEAETTTTTEAETTTTAPEVSLFAFGTAGTICAPNGVPFVTIVFQDTFPELAGVTGSVSLLYPGAEVDANGNPIDLPGFNQVDGVWSEDDSDAILLEGLLLTYELGDETATAEIEYPPADTVCAAPVNFGPPPNTTTPVVPDPPTTTVLVKVDPPAKAAAVITPPTEVGGVQAEPLPRTGADSSTLFAVSLGLLASGFALVVAGDGFRILGIRRR